MLVIVGRNTWAAVLARGNLHLALQPLVAGATFIVYCPLMLLGFAINRCTPPIVVRPKQPPPLKHDSQRVLQMLAMAVLGSVHFLFEAATCGSFWADLARLNQAQPANLPPGPELEAVALLLEAVGADSDPRFAADSLLLQCMIASAAAAAFVADVFLTTKYALLRRQPYNTLPPLL